MAYTVAVNGFGRIGRMVFRQLMEHEDFEVAAVNDIAPLDNLAYLLRHDSVYVPPQATVTAGDGKLHWGDREIPVLSEKDPATLPWRDLGVDLVIEATGIFRSRDDAAKHLEAGAKRVVITAPGKGVDATFCMGVNHSTYDPAAHEVVSNASCTTNCLAPVARVLHEQFGVEYGFLTTVHAYTSSQGIVDGPHTKWRRGRAGAANIVPTSTGAAIATTVVLPELEGRLDGMAMRVPVPCGSIIDFVVQTEQTVSVDSVNRAFRDAARDDSYAGVLTASDDELVSQDIVAHPSSAVVDLPSTMTLGDNTAKVLAWYDNEFGYSSRVVDLATYMLRYGA